MQVDTCIQEGVRLATLINNQAPVVATDPVLSHLIAADWNAATFRREESTVQEEGPSTDSLVVGGGGCLLSLNRSLVWAMSFVCILWVILRWLNTVHVCFSFNYQSISAVFNPYTYIHLLHLSLLCTYYKMPVLSLVWCVVWIQNKFNITNISYGCIFYIIASHDTMHMEYIIHIPV